MASKRFTKHPCVYCQIRPSTTTGDHIFAREFFLVRDRHNLPRAPCCAICGGEKSRDEHYLTTVLPFGGRHAVARENLVVSVPRRLAKNRRLHQELASGMMSSADGKPAVMPLETDRIESLFRRISVGLLWHSWGMYLPVGHEVQCAMLTPTGEQFMSRLFEMNAEQRVRGRPGNGTFDYVGALGTGDDPISVWQFAIYGGLQMTDDRNDVHTISRSIGCVTGRSEMFEKHPFK